MSQIEWAENEVRIACEREKARNEKEDFDFTEYACGCYQSALKAFKSLAEDEHSGLSFSITQQILNHLMNGNPLTPIEDVPEVWGHDLGDTDSDHITYQCKRKSSLFKYVYSDGRVEYHDVDRARGMDASGFGPYSGWVVSHVIDELFPITFPYVPENKPYMAYTTEYLTDRKNGDYDTVHVRYIEKPDGTCIDVNRYFGEVYGRMQEISHDEFVTRRDLHYIRETYERR